MQISHVRISNILGIEDLEFTPAGFNQISGRNGLGKSSVLEAIKAAIRGGHDATLLRNGAEKGEVVLVLDDGTELRKRVTPATSTTDLVKDGKKLARPQAAIQALADMLSVNPVEFLTAPAKDRVRVLLESMPLQADANRLTQIVGFEVNPPPGTHALQVIDQVRKSVYDARTGANRAVREKDATIKTLQQALPPAPEGAAEGDEVALQSQLQEMDDTLETEKNRIEEKLTGLRGSTAGTIEALRDDARKKIDAIKAQLELDVEAQRAHLADIESKAGRQRVKALDKHADESRPVKLALMRIRDDREAYARRQQTLDTITNLDVELGALEREAERHTTALERLDDYKLELLSSLPIPGLEVRDGELFLGGIPFDRLNTASQVGVAVEIAKLRAGELGVICVDRIEALDSATLEAFRDRALASELQLFVTRVSDEEFAIESQS